jgi:hypothetical protein
MVKASFGLGGSDALEKHDENVAGKVQACLQ